MAEPLYRALVGITIDPVDEGETELRFESGETLAGVHPADLQTLIDGGHVQLIGAPAPTQAPAKAPIAPSPAPQEPATAPEPASAPTSPPESSEGATQAPSESPAAPEPDHTPEVQP